jgi:hypothetical protein
MSFGRLIKFCRFNNILLLTGRDYLDGSCMVYNKQKLLFPIDYSNWKVSSTGEDLFHSGDIMNHTNRTGKHTINLSLKNLPDRILLVFLFFCYYSVILLLLYCYYIVIIVILILILILIYFYFYFYFVLFC